MTQSPLVLALGLAGAFAVTAFASGNDSYEVWAIDQSNSPGLTYGARSTSGTGTTSRSAMAPPPQLSERIDLGGASARSASGKQVPIPFGRT